MRTYRQTVSFFFLYVAIRNSFRSNNFTSREVHEARLPRTCSRPCAFEVKKTKKNTKYHQTLKKHTMKYIHSSPATATTPRRRAVKHVPLGSPHWHPSFIDIGIVEIGLACIHTYAYTRNAACLLYTSPSPRDRG